MSEANEKNHSLLTEVIIENYSYKTALVLAVRQSNVISVIRAMILMAFRNVKHQAATVLQYSFLAKVRFVRGYLVAVNDSVHKHLCTQKIFGNFIHTKQ